MDAFWYEWAVNHTVAPPPCCKITAALRLLSRYLQNRQRNLRFFFRFPPLYQRSSWEPRAISDSWKYRAHSPYRVSSGAADTPSFCKYRMGLNWAFYFVNSSNTETTYSATAVCTRQPVFIIDGKFANSVFPDTVYQVHTAYGIKSPP